MAEKTPKYLFPSDEAALAQAMEVSLSLGKANQRGRILTWLIHYFYLQGVRQFPFINVGTGGVKISWVTNEGAIPFKYPGALKQHMTEMGRLLQVNVDPWVEAVASGGMTVLRDRALAQVTLDAMTNQENRDRAKSEVINLLLNFGTAGLAPYIYGTPDTGYAAELEAIPPWELNPIPHAPFSRSQIRGISRDRYIPLSEGVARWGKPKLSANFSELETIRLPYGEFEDRAMADSPIGPTGIHDMTVTPGPTNATGDKSTLRGELQDEGSMVYMHLHEMWLEGRSGELRRYVARSGRVILEDIDFPEGGGLVTPVRVSRYGDTGGFYGASYADLTIGLNREAEKNIQSLLQNARNLDRYGFLVIPSDMGQAVKTHMQDQGNGLRLIFYQQGQFQDRAQRPQVINPATTGNFPGDVAAFVVGQLNQMTRDSNLTLPARTDSPNAIQMIDEAARRPITQAVESIARQFGGAYKYIVMNATEFYAQKTPVYLTEIDDHLAGVVLNPSTGAVELSLASQPSVAGLNFTIRAANPRQKEVIKQEIASLIQMGAITPDRFQFLNIRHKLDMPFPETPETNTYRTAMLNNLLLFNDGQTPGQVLVSSIADNPRVALEVTTTFMSRPFFRFASVPVRQAFEKLVESYRAILTIPQMQAMGQPFPEDIMERGEMSQEPQPQPRQ